MSSASELRTVLRHGDFRKLFATRMASQAADGMFQVALASYVFFSPERAGTASSAAATFAVLLLPYTVVGPFAGVLLDRWRRRQVLVGASIARAVIVALVALVAWQDITGPLFYTGALVALSVNRFFLAALSAAMPHVVERDELIMANSISVTAGSIAAMAGGGIGLAAGALGGAHGDPINMLVAAVAYLSAAGFATRMHRDLLGPDLADAPPAVREAVKHVAAGLADGTRHIWHKAPARNALAATTALRFCYALAALAAILLYRNHFNDPSGDGDEALAELGVVFGAGAVGYFLAALITPAVSGRIGKPKLIVYALLVAGVLGFALGIPYTPPLVIAGSFVLGVTTQTVKICVDTIVQESITDAYRGRVFAVYDTVFNLAFVSAAGLGALAMPDSGKSYPLLVGVSLGYLLTAGLYWQSVAWGADGPGDQAEKGNESVMSSSRLSEAATEDAGRT